MRLTALANRALVIKLLAALTTYGFTILLAHVLAPRDFGKIAFFLNLALVLSVVGARGQQMAALRFIPPMLDRREFSALDSFRKWATRRAVFGTGAVFLGALALGLGIKFSGGLPGHSVAQIGLGLALIPLVGWIDLQSHMARGYQLLGLSLIPKEILWRGAASATILLAIFLGRGAAPDATFVMASLALSLAAIACIQAMVLRRRTQQTAPPAQRQNPDSRGWHAASTPFWITSVSNIFLANADVILVGLFGGATAAGVYFAANRLALLLAFFLTSYNVVLAPVLASTWQRGTRSEIGEIVLHATVKMTLPTLVLGAILATFAPQFLGLFGSEFVQTTAALRILILAGLINAAAGPADIALNMCGHHQSAMRASAVSLGLSAVLLVIGASFGGVTAIAVAVLIAGILRKAMFWWLALRHLAIRTDILAAFPSRRASVPGPQT